MEPKTSKKGAKMEPKWLPETFKFEVKINAEKGWEKFEQKHEK